MIRKYEDDSLEIEASSGGGISASIPSKETIGIYCCCSRVFCGNCQVSAGNEFEKGTP